MTAFTVTHEATAVLPVTRQAVWDVLTDPSTLAELTPLLTSIEEQGEHWVWRMAKVPGLSLAVAPEFTERMTFTELERIEFRHDPPAGRTEDAGAEGWYALGDAADGAVDLAISLAITVDLPLPRLSAPAVKAAMKRVVVSMGAGFAENLDRHLGL
ncbi:MAG TPA: SRPBCC family protein [Nocardioides sp.]